MSLSLPNNLSPRDILLNKVCLQVMILAGVFYGIVVTLGFSCLHLLSASPEAPQGEPQPSRQRNKWLRIYVVFLLVLSTVEMVLKGRQIENAYVYHTNYPGGPAGFISEDLSPTTVVQVICFVLLQWASDGLLLWRCLCFFSGATSRVQVPHVVIALLSFINVALSAIFIITIAFSQYFRQSAHSIMLLYGFYTLFLNTGITLAIVMRLYLHRRAMTEIFGPGHGKFYLGIISVLIESAAVIIVYDLFYLVPAVLQSPLSMIGLLGYMAQIIPPLMIIQRVAKGTDSCGQMQSTEAAIGSRSVLGFVTGGTENSTEEMFIGSTTSARSDDG